jgi:solute carrier family 45, member 1/2/4
LIFRIVDGAGPESNLEDKYFGKNGVAWVLRFGGLCTLVSLSRCFSNAVNGFSTQMGALIARMVSPTPTEKEMRRRLGELRELQRDSTP